MNHPLSVTGRTALITGGNRGIGLGMAEALAQAGANVVIWGRNEERNERAAQTLRSYGVKVLACPVDVSDEAAVRAAMESAVHTMGRLDMVVANAAVPGAGTPFIETSLEEFRRVARVNLEGAFVTLREGARQMIAAGQGGSLVGVSSFSALHGAARNQAYAATKSGILGIVHACAVEFARYGIRANAVMPGFVDTEMTDTILASDGFQKKVLPRLPLRRWGQPRDFGGIAVYLLSDASAYHTGDTLRVDGGYVVY